MTDKWMLETDGTVTGTRLLKNGVMVPLLKSLKVSVDVNPLSVKIEMKKFQLTGGVDVVEVGKEVHVKTDEEGKPELVEEVVMLGEEGKL